MNKLLASANGSRVKSFDDLTPQTQRAINQQARVAILRQIRDYGQRIDALHAALADCEKQIGRLEKRAG